MPNAAIAYVKGAKINKSMPLATMRHTCCLLMDLQGLPLTFIQNSNSISDPFPQCGPSIYPSIVPLFCDLLGSMHIVCYIFLLLSARSLLISSIWNKLRVILDPPFLPPHCSGVQRDFLWWRKCFVSALLYMEPLVTRDYWAVEMQLLGLLEGT